MADYRTAFLYAKLISLFALYYLFLNKYEKVRRGQLANNYKQQVL